MRRPAKAAPLDRGSSYGCHHVVSGLVWLGERRALERGGRGWLRVIHYGGSGEQVSAKPEGPTDGAGGSEYKQLGIDLSAHRRDHRGDRRGRTWQLYRSRNSRVVPPSVLRAACHRIPHAFRPVHRLIPVLRGTFLPLGALPVMKGSGGVAWIRQIRRPIQSRRKILFR
jgi:hypothetical protein